VAKNLNLNAKEKITSAQQLLDRFRKPGSLFDLSNADFYLSANVLAIIKAEPVEGIEVIRATKEDHQGDEISAMISPGFHCSYLRFCKPVNITGSLFSGPLIFKNAIFEKGLYFQRSQANTYVNFEQVEIMHNASVSSNIIMGKFMMSNCKIPLQKPGFKYSHFHEESLFVRCHFFLGMDLSTSKFDKGLQIIQCKIEQKLDLSDSQISGSLVVAGSIDGTEKQEIDEFQFHDFAVKGQFQLRSNIIFQRLNGARAKFSSSVFINFVELHGDKNSFNANKFDQVVEMTDCHIEKHISFSYSTFQANFNVQKNTFERADLYFTGCHFHSNVFIGQHHLIDGIHFEGKLGFLNATIGPDSIVGIFGFNNARHQRGEFIFNNALIKGLLDIRNVFAKEVTFDGTVVPGNVQENGSIASAVYDRSTARLLKNEARKINNQIAGLTYYKKEVQAHARSLSWRQMDDRLMLWLNKLSNNYGTSWSRGVVFTLLSSVIFYSAFYVCWFSFNALGKSDLYWTGLINYFWLPSGLEGLIDNHNNIHGGWLGAIFFILGKVLIAYGIYQTVSAFRKYL
jgi:hypothetical protein